MRLLLLAIALLCAVQMSRADIVPSLEALRDKVLAAKTGALATANAAIDFVVDGVATVANGIVSVVNGAINVAQNQVNNLIDEAQADGVAAIECGVTATATLTKIALDLPVGLTHCFTDYINAFDPYIEKIENDFQDILAGIVTAIHDSGECWVSILCQAKVYANVTLFEAKKSADVAFQLLQIETAKINLIASITKCDVEKKIDALLDIAKVVPQTVTCIAKKRAELKN